MSDEGKVYLLSRKQINSIAVRAKHRSHYCSAGNCAKCALMELLRTGELPLGDFEIPLEHRE